MNKKIHIFEDKEEGITKARFICLGCSEKHQVYIAGNNVPIWGYNGNEGSPTFTPSVLVRGVSLPEGDFPKDENGKFILGSDGRIKGAKDTICHSFITNGKIQYLGDCTHQLGGQTIELPDYK